MSAGTGSRRMMLTEEDDPILFYRHLRQQSSIPVLRSAPQHELVELELLADDETTDNSTSTRRVIRLMHLAQLLPITGKNAAVYVDAPGFFALKHFNERSNEVVPNLSELLDGCNLYLTMDMLNSESSALAASGKMYRYFSKPSSLVSPQPAAFVGAFFSSVSRALAILAGTFGVPLISPSSTSGALDDLGAAPTFGRTIPTNKGMAEAAVLYLERMGVTSFAVLTMRSDYGTSFLVDVARAAEPRGIDIVSVAYEPNNENSMIRAVAELKASQRKYIFGIVGFDDYADVLSTAYDGELVGPDYLWILPEIDSIAQDGFSVDRTKHPGLAAGVQGALVLNLQKTSNAAFDESVSRLQTDAKLQFDFLALHPEADSAYDTTINLTGLTPVLTSFSYTSYDAVISLGIAACQAEADIFTGEQLFASFKNTSFTGASGAVLFDPITGTRNFETVSFSFRNVFADESRSNDEKIVFTSRVSTIVDFDADQVVQTINPTIYNNGSTTPPLPLPPLNVETSTVPIGVLAIGWAVSMTLILSCCYLGWWVHKYRLKHIVSAAQPQFLFMLLVGAFLIACSILPLTFQGLATWGDLDIACMATPWLFICGFATAFSAIFSKALRIKRVVREAMAVRRASVYARNVLYPCIFIMSINVILLIAWSVVSPLVWTQMVVENSYDEFGRPVETYSVCTGQVDEETGKGQSWVFPVLLGVVNVMMVVYAFYQAFATRNMPSDFNESIHVTLCIGILLEAFLLGAPILFLVQNDPLASFIVKVLLLASFCGGFLGPNFLPKLFEVRKEDTPQDRTAALREWGTYVSNAQRHDNSGGERSFYRKRAKQERMLASATELKAANLAAAAAKSSNNSGLPSSVADLKARINARAKAAMAAALETSSDDAGLEYCPEAYATA